MTDSVLFSRSKDNKNMEEDCDHENPWDDTLLIEAYDRAISLAKTNLAKNKSNLNNSKNPLKNNNTKLVDSFKESTEVRSSGASSAYTGGGWKVGSHCRVVWTQDGIEYEAEIVSLRTNRNQARVRFVGYNNEENTKLNLLKPSHGEEARQLQISESLCDVEENGLPSSNFNTSHISAPLGTEEGMMFPPPPPPHVISYLPKGEQEALSAMLMSWYMSGYHTGYYQGLINNARSNSVNKKK